MDFAAKLSHLLTHWVEHNDAHAQTYREWAEKAVGEGFPSAGAEIKRAIEAVEAASACLRAALHALRDRIGLENAVHLGAQLPMLLRGAYYEGWHPAATPDARTPPGRLHRSSGGATAAGDHHQPGGGRACVFCRDGALPRSRRADQDARQPAS